MGNLPNWPPSWTIVLLLPALFVGYTVHELAHALVAFLLGDTSQVEHNRLSFNPLRHVSWLGMAAFLLIKLGWAKPMWVDPSRFRIKNRAFGTLLVSIAGVSANLLTAVVVFLGMATTATVVWMLTGVSPVVVLESLAIPEPGLDAQGLVVALTSYMVMVNLSLAFVNLLPFPLSDGFHALMSVSSLIRSALKRGDKVESTTQPVGDTATNGAAPLNPAQIHFGIGLTYHKAGQLDEAIARYRQAIAQDKSFAPAYYNQGLAYWTKGRLSLATSAFRAAMQSSSDAGVRIQADLRLRELAQAAQEPESEMGPAPPPLESWGTVEAVADVAQPLDPTVVRRVWLRLAIGGVLMLILAVMMWLYVTAVILASLG
jgi:Zn-dependent protease/tetrahydromethanopterin S-methyltransferase subunit B